MFITKRKTYSVYIMTNKKNAGLYTGMINNINKRNFQHKNKIFENSFTKKYNVDKLVYFENLDTLDSSIRREKQIKAGSLAKKIELINKNNKEWIDLSDNFWRLLNPL